MSAWIVPYVDHPPDFWHEIHDRFGTEIREVYFPLPGRLAASGRGPQPEQHLEAFLRHASLAKGVLVNPIILPEPVEAMAPPIIGALRRLQGEFGVAGATVANLALARAIKEALPGMSVAASVLMGIADPAQALVARDCVDAITADGRLVRDVAGLRRLRSAFDGELRMIVNEACLPGCLYRTQHFYEMGYGVGMPRSLCQGTLEERPWLRLTGAWILPRHLHWFDGLVDGFKLAGRVTLRDPVLYQSVLEAYVRRLPILPRDIGGGPASPLEAVDVTDGWFEAVLHCDKQCDVCTLCSREYQKALGSIGRTHA